MHDDFRLVNRVHLHLSWGRHVSRTLAVRISSGLHHIYQTFEPTKMWWTFTWSPSSKQSILKLSLLEASLELSRTLRIAQNHPKPFPFAKKNNPQNFNQDTNSGRLQSQSLTWLVLLLFEPSTREDIVYQLHASTIESAAAWTSWTTFCSWWKFPSWEWLGWTNNLVRRAIPLWPAAQVRTSAPNYWTVKIENFKMGLLSKTRELATSQLAIWCQLAQSVLNPSSRPASRSSQSSGKGSGSTRWTCKGLLNLGEVQKQSRSKRTGLEFCNKLWVESTGLHSSRSRGKAFPTCSKCHTPSTAESPVLHIQCCLTLGCNHHNSSSKRYARRLSSRQ